MKTLEQKIKHKDGDIRLKRTKEGLIKRIYWNQRELSKKRGHHLPNYEFSELRDWAFNQPIFHSLFDNWVKSNYEKYIRPSFDRIDNKKPYTLDNLQIMTLRANCYKGSTLELDRTMLEESVYQKLPNGKVLAWYRSIMEAERITGIDDGHIKKVCNGEHETAGTFRWELAPNILAIKIDEEKIKKAITNALQGYEFHQIVNGTRLLEIKQLINELAKTTLEALARERPDVKP